ncbi:MAG: hypothetical protein KatS3mg048_0619 [Caldilinea sp.]|nr:MAG: hypothetical protein KatS3mg048_0619 [Caldilinea sp.]
MLFPQDHLTNFRQRLLCLLAQPLVEFDTNGAFERNEVENPFRRRRPPDFLQH